MRLISRPFWLFALCVTSTTWALHESDAGVVDWHKKLVGVPLVAAPAVEPAFNKIGNREMITVASASNAFAVLDAEDGGVVWRRVFDAHDRIAGYYTNDSTIAILSGLGGTTLRTLDANTGDLILEKHLPKPNAGLVNPQNPYHGSDVVFSQHSADLYVLSGGNTVSNIDALTGEVKWTWRSDKTRIAKVTPTQTTLYLTLLTPNTPISNNPPSFSLSIQPLTPSTGEPSGAAYRIPSQITDPTHNIAVLLPYHPATAGGVEEPTLLWKDKDVLRTLPLGSHIVARAAATANIKTKTGGVLRLVDVGLDARGVRVGVGKDGEGFVIRFEAGTTKVWEFVNSAASEDQAESMYTGGVDEEGRVYVARMYWSFKLKKAFTDIYAPHLESAKVTQASLSRTHAFGFNTKADGTIAHISLSIPNSEPNTAAPRLLVSTSTGAIQLWARANDSNTDTDHTASTTDDSVLTPQWTREESLASVPLAEFVELPEAAAVAGGVAGSEGFIGRLWRHLGDMQDFPTYALNFARRFVGGPMPPSPSNINVEAQKTPLPLVRDPFGLRQVLVLPTLFGKVFGVDASTGSVVWSRVLGLGWAGEIGGSLRVVKVFVVRGVNDVRPEGEGRAEVVLVVQRRASNSLVDTVVFHLDAITGEDVSGSGLSAGAETEADGPLEGVDVIQGPMVDAFMAHAGDTKFVILLDEFLQVYLYPDTNTTRTAFQDIAHTLTFPVRTTTPPTTQGNGPQERVVGHQIAPSSGSVVQSTKTVAHPTWSLALPPNERIRALVPPTTPHAPVASVGRVLGNRTTLYKYLNPRGFVLLSEDAGRGVCVLRVVDGVKGTVVYRSEVGRGRGVVGCEVRAVLVENWLVWHYYDGDAALAEGGAKGWRMVSVEFYEGGGVDEKVMSSDLSSYSNSTLNMHYYERAYVFPYAITAIAATTTKFGITSKDIIVATSNNRIQSFPRRALDPRRPDRKPTAEELEEFLVQYDPMLPNDPKRVLSHNYDVAKIHRITTSPALLESTSLVLAHGLDLFVTRVTPSGTFDVLSENFNKVQLVLTVSGLVAAILVTRPMVRRKRLREKWYSS